MANPAVVAIEQPTWELVIHGAPRTKKNHGSRIQRGRKRYNIPSHQWTWWVKTCQVELMHARTGEWWPDWRSRLTFFSCPLKGDAIIDEKKRRPHQTQIEKRAAKLRLNCRAHIYRDADRGDANGYYQGIADLLEKLGVLSNDRMLVSWNGSELLKDAEKPHVHVVLAVVP